MTRFEVFGVGARPAGSTAARELAASGARVLIADRESPPRHSFSAIESGRITAVNVIRALGGGDLRTYEPQIDAQIMPELRPARYIELLFYGSLRRTGGAWMFASAHTPFLWNAFFAVQRGESTGAREAADVRFLPALVSLASS